MLLYDSVMFCHQHRQVESHQHTVRCYAGTSRSLGMRCTNRSVDLHVPCCWQWHSTSSATGCFHRCPWFALRLRSC